MDKETNGDRLRESSYVMAQVAYLCQSVSPELASKATQAAMAVLLKVGHLILDTLHGGTCAKLIMTLRLLQAESAAERDGAAGDSELATAEGAADDGKSRQDEMKQKAANVTALVCICSVRADELSGMKCYEDDERGARDWA